MRRGNLLASRATLDRDTLKIELRFTAHRCRREWLATSTHLVCTANVNKGLYLEGWTLQPSFFNIYLLIEIGLRNDLTTKAKEDRAKWRRKCRRAVPGLQRFTADVNGVHTFLTRVGFELAKIGVLTTSPSSWLRKSTIPNSAVQSVKIHYPIMSRLTYIEWLCPVKNVQCGYKSLISDDEESPVIDGRQMGERKRRPALLMNEFNTDGARGRRNYVCEEPAAASGMKHGAHTDGQCRTA